MSDVSDTIFAQATGAGRGGIAIIRISGPASGTLLDRLTRPRPRARKATLRDLVGENGILDRGLVLWFPGPGSYTGEDCVELHLHAGPAVVDAVSESLRSWGGRPAEPGEFTRRAFMRGRIDLIEAEGIADLIDAETETQRQQALAQSTGQLSEIYIGWAARVRRLVAGQEALIDFPAESDDVEDDGFAADITSLEHAMLAHLADGKRGEALRRGLTIAVVGEPNVGKSSIINSLSERDVSIVSGLPGTTRDVVETRLVIGDVPITLLDTAGLRESGDEVEQEGVRRARHAAEIADLVLVVTSGHATTPLNARAPGAVWVSNKVDLEVAPCGALAVSAKTGEGIPTLRKTLANIAQRITTGAPVPTMTRTRHRSCIQTTLDHLHRARTATIAELRAEDLRQALHSLGRLTGDVGVDDLLGDIFSTFCIGK